MLDAVMQSARRFALLYQTTKETEPMTLRKMQLITVLVILVLLIFAAKAPAQSRPRTVTPPAAEEAVKVLKKDGTEAHLCGAPTKAGGKCKRRVKAKSELCFMHRGK